MYRILYVDNHDNCELSEKESSNIKDVIEYASLYSYGKKFHIIKIINWEAQEIPS
jgi:hypothetical protein